MHFTKQSLIDARTSVATQTALLTIRSQFGNRDKIIWIVVEGKNDPCYYLNTICNILPNDWEVTPIEAGNKINVIAVFNSLDWTIYDKKRILFFVDRDLSDFVDKIEVNSENFYITDGYSIENSLVSEDVLLRILGELLGLHNLSEKEKSAIIMLFQEAKRTFIKEMLIPMIIILLTQEKGIATDSLNNINIQDIVLFSRGDCLPRKNKKELYDYVIKKLVINVALTKIDYCKCEKRFLSHKNHENLIRGKYMLAFLVSFANSIRNEWKYLPFATTCPQKPSMSLGFKNAFENVAVRARTVSSLRIFYKKSIIGNWLN